MSEKPSFFAELKRRHVVRVTIAYAVTAWLILQLAAIVLPTFGAPHWVLKVLIGVFVFCFPLAIMLAWAFEVTPDGVRRTVPAESEAARPAGHGRRVGRVLNVGIIVVLAAAVGVLAWRQFGTKPQAAKVAVAASVATPSAASVPSPRTMIPAKSIAVLPFANDSDDPKQQYFSDGLSEDLIIALSQYPGLKVIGRESSFQLRNTALDSRQIGAKLGVADLLEGSVSREGNEVRIRAELVDAADGSTLWSDFYDRPYQNLFALQDDITKAVTSTLKAKLLGSTQPGAVVQTDRPPSGSLAAYNAYLEGNYYWNELTEQSIRQAIAAYRRAIKIDPKYAAAYARLSYAWTTLGGFFLGGTAMNQAFAKARTTAETALKLDPHSAAAYVAQGRLLWTTLNWRGAAAAFRRALTLDPSITEAKRLVAKSLASVGELHAAVRLGREAVKADPLDARVYRDLAQYLSSVDDTAAALQAIRQAISYAPRAATFHAFLAVIDIQRGDARGALAAAKAAPSSAWRAYALALAYRAANQKARADKALRALITKYGSGYAFQIAGVYAYRGNADQAFAWLDRAWRQHDPGIGWLLFDPFLLRYKNDPRFAAFCKKVGLPVPGLTTSAATAEATPS